LSTYIIYLALADLEEVSYAEVFAALDAFMAVVCVHRVWFIWKSHIQRVGCLRPRLYGDFGCSG
jgi:hypothetical protein